MPSSLSQKAEQQLLADIENAGLPLDQMSLVDLCDSKEGICGAPGLPRRPVQLRFQKIKELTSRGYRRLLAQHSISPGPATLAAAQQDTDEDELVLSDDEEEVTTDDEDIDIDLSSAFGSMKMCSPEKTPTKTPTKKVLFLPTASVPSPDMTLSSTEDHADAANCDWGADPALDATLDFRRQTGTKSHPRIVLADPDYAAHNCPFDVAPIENVEHNNHQRDGFHVVIPVALPDMHRWEGIIPSKKEFPNLAPLLGRVIVIKCPSRDFWQRRATRHHHAGKGKVDCPITKTQHEKTDTAIKGDPDRQTSCFVIVFRKSFLLDNCIFSGNTSAMTVSKNGMKIESSHPDCPFKTNGDPVRGVCVWWRIGIDGGTKIRDVNVADTADDCFD